LYKNWQRWPVKYTHSHPLDAMALAGLGTAGKSQTVVLFLLPYSPTHSASIIAVVTLGQKVISTCSAYGISYKNASKDMEQLSHEIWRLLLVLKAIHKLIKDEETKTSTRLPALTAAFNASYEHKTQDRPAENEGPENESGLEGNNTHTTPSIQSGRRGMIKRFGKKLMGKEPMTTVETKGSRTNSMSNIPPIA
jgi:hypothetical protein